MRQLVLLVLLALAHVAFGEASLRITAPEFHDQPVVLFRYMDLFTLRTEVIATGRTDAQGSAYIRAEVAGRTRVQLRIGEARTDLYLMPDGRYDLIFQRVKGNARSIAGTTQAEVLFNGMEALDINALTSDLNERLDAFIAEDLATDQAAGMQAVDVMRKGGTPPPDSSARPNTLFVNPSWSEARVDTFEKKLKRFYAGVDDPWFMGTLEYGVAGLRFGPRANDKELYDRYLKGRPVRYDDPEYIRFLRSLFEDHLMRFTYLSHEAELLHTVSLGNADSVKKVFATHDFLSSDDRLCELVAMNELHGEYNGKVLDKAAVLRTLEQLATRSTYPEHRIIAKDMVWDLTAMRPGSRMPSLRLTDMKGNEVQLDSLLKGPVLIAFTAAWCTYCEVEMSALESLYDEYGKLITFIGIGVDPGQEALSASLRLHPKRDWTWLHAPDDGLLMETLRLRSLPQFLLLNDTNLVHSPAPMPSQGMQAILYRMKLAAEEENKIKFGNEQQPPKPPQR